MSENSNLENIIFLDIETVPGCKSLSEVDDALRQLWIEKNTKKRSKKDESESGEKATDDDECNYGDAGLKAEFGRVVCVSLGRFEGGTEPANLKVHSLYSHDEKEILQKLSAILGKYPEHLLCAHNGKNFDFPFLGKRFLINGIPLPSHLNIMGKKPWEVPHIDTNDLWSFGAKGPGAGAALKLLCAVFGIPTPKDDIDGSQVRSVYYQENDLERIVRYCEKDVISLAAVYRKLMGV